MNEKNEGNQSKPPEFMLSHLDQNENRALEPQDKNKRVQSEKMRYENADKIYE
jgi:hypothetical protein